MLIPSTICAVTLLLVLDTKSVAYNMTKWKRSGAHEATRSARFGNPNDGGW